MKYLLMNTLLIATNLLFAQDKIIVEYSYRNSFDISTAIDDHSLNLYKNSNEKIHYYTLTIDNNEAIQRLDNSQEEEKPVISGPIGKSYINLITREKLYEVDYLGKYIIKDSIDVVEWKITRERGTHLGYETKKATYKNKNLEYEAWFVPNLPLKFGPSGYGELPGLIVKFTQYFHFNKGRHKRTYIADKISIDPKLKIIKPSKGKVISQKEFNTIVAAHRKKQEDIETNKVNMKID